MLEFVDVASFVGFGIFVAAMLLVLHVYGDPK